MGLMGAPVGKDYPWFERWAEQQPLLGDASWIEASDQTGHEFQLPFTGRHRMRVGLGSVLPVELTRTVFYGNMIVKENEFMGLAEYYNTLNPNQAQNAVNVINGGARGRDCTSVYLICWSPSTLCLAYSSRGLVDQNGKAQVAVVPVDWRFAARICNIDVMRGDLDIACALQEAMLRIPDCRRGRTAFYMNVEVQNLLKAQTGNRADAHAEIPIRIVNELRNDESLV